MIQSQFFSEFLILCTIKPCFVSKLKAIKPLCNSFSRWFEMCHRQANGASKWKRTLRLKRVQAKSGKHVSESFFLYRIRAASRGSKSHRKSSYGIESLFWWRLWAPLWGSFLLCHSKFVCRSSTGLFKYYNALTWSIPFKSEILSSLLSLV